MGKDTYATYQALRRRKKEIAMQDSDFERGKFEGDVLARLNTIEAKLDSFTADLVGVKRFQDNQKAYYVAFVFLGGLIVSLVDKGVELYNKLKN